MTRNEDAPIGQVLTSERRSMLGKRAEILASVRRTLQERGFTEFDTPILQVSRGSALPAAGVSFTSVTENVVLRTNPNAMKQILAEGFDAIFEIARTFRDELVDSTHVVEYSLIEIYRAYADYQTMRDLAVSLIVSITKSVTGSTVIRDDLGREVDLAQPWRSVTLHEVVTEHLGTDVSPETDVERIAKICRLHGVTIPNVVEHGAMVLALYENLVEHTLISPTIVTDFPVSVAPLAATHSRTPGLAEKWDLVVFGREVATSYTEIVDPLELAQRRRQFPDSLEMQAIDHELVALLQRGLPPCGGLAVGLERLIMTITGSTDIRAVAPLAILAN